MRAQHTRHQHTQG